MAVDEPTRYELFRWFTEQMPEHLAEAMMKSIPPTGWGDVATRNDLVANGVLLRGEMAEVRGEMATLGPQLRGEIMELRGEMHLGFARMQRSFVVATVVSALSSWGLLLAAIGLT